IIKNQYYIKDTFYNYYGNDKHYDYKNNTRPFNYYITGFSKNTLDDSYGTFYIIHPDELCIKRNILGIIIDVNENNNCNVTIKDNKIISYKMKVFWYILKENLLIIPDQKINDVFKTQ